MSRERKPYIDRTVHERMERYRKRIKERYAELQQLELEAANLFVHMTGRMPTSTLEVADWIAEFEKSLPLRKEEDAS